MSEKELIKVVHGTVVSIEECRIPTDMGFSLIGSRVVIQPDNLDEEPITEIIEDNHSGFSLNQRVIRFDYVSYRDITEQEKLIYVFREEKYPRRIPIYTHETFDEVEYLGRRIGGCKRS